MTTDITITAKTKRFAGENYIMLMATPNREIRSDLLMYFGRVSNTPFRIELELRLERTLRMATAAGYTIDVAGGVRDMIAAAPWDNMTPRPADYDWTQA